MILEDDRDIRELLCLILGHEYEVAPVDCAASFWERLQHITPHAILLDIMLPDGNGIDICRELKGKNETKTIPVIMMSAHHKELQKDCGAQDFIRKPFDINDLRTRIAQYVA